MTGPRGLAWARWIVPRPAVVLTSGIVGVPNTRNPRSRGQVARAAARDAAGSQPSFRPRDAIMFPREAGNGWALIRPHLATRPSVGRESLRSLRHAGVRVVVTVH